MVLMYVLEETGHFVPLSMCRLTESNGGSWTFGSPGDLFFGRIHVVVSGGTSSRRLPDFVDPGRIVRPSPIDC